MTPRSPWTSGESTQAKLEPPHEKLKSAFEREMAGMGDSVISGAPDIKLLDKKNGQIQDEVTGVDVCASCC